VNRSSILEHIHFEGKWGHESLELPKYIVTINSKETCVDRSSTSGEITPREKVV
jgi:hypothetical protein